MSFDFVNFEEYNDININRNKNIESRLSDISVEITEQSDDILEDYVIEEKDDIESELYEHKIDNKQFQISNSEDNMKKYILLCKIDKLREAYPSLKIIDSLDIHNNYRELLSVYNKARLDYILLNNNCLPMGYNIKEKESIESIDNHNPINEIKNDKDQLNIVKIKNIDDKPENASTTELHQTNTEICPSEEWKNLWKNSWKNSYINYHPSSNTYYDDQLHDFTSHSLSLNHEFDLKYDYDYDHMLSTLKKVPSSNIRFDDVD